MSYFVLCTFDLKLATSDDYKTAYADLAAMGLNKVIVSDKGSNTVIPATSVAGQFNGADAASVQNDIRDRVKNKFAARGFSSEVFVLVGGDWAWGAANT